MAASTPNEEAARIHAVAAQFLDAWSTHEPERVLACYTEDVEYKDPNLATAIRGAAALDRYLRRLFTEWRMQWRLDETLAISGGDGAAVMWHATFRRIPDERVVEVDGMDLVVLRGDRIRRNHVFFDRVALAPLGFRGEPPIAGAR